MRIARTLIAVALAVESVLLLSGCGGGGAAIVLPDPRFRLVNASPDSTALDVTVDDGTNDLTKASQIAYGALSTQATVKAGARDVVLYEHGNPVSLDALVNSFSGDTNNLFAAVGLENFGTEYLKRVRLVNVTYSSTPPNGNKARLIIVHAFERAAGYDTPNVDFQNPGDNPTFSTTDIAPGGFKTLEVDSGSQEFQVWRHGTQTAGASPYADVTTTLTAGKVYVVLICGVEGSVTSPPDIKYVQLALPTTG